MENQLEHFLPEGQTEIGDSILICDNTHLCETCSSFLYSLSEMKIKEFVEGDDFTFDCSGVRIIIPASKETSEFFALGGIQKIIKEISQKELDEEKEFVDWDKTSSILTVTPFFVDETTGEVGLCLDILLKPYLDIFKVYFLEVRLEELRLRYPEIQFEFRDTIFQNVLNDEFLDKQIGNSEMSEFLRFIEKFITELELDELKFMLCWGVFDVKRKENGDWFVPMLDLNQQVKHVHK